MKLNILKLFVERLLATSVPFTHEGAPTAVLTPEQSLRRSVLSCMLWEDEFYEDDQAIGARIYTGLLHAGVRRPIATLNPFPPRSVKQCGILVSAGDVRLRVAQAFPDQRFYWLYVASACARGLDRNLHPSNPDSTKGVVRATCFPVFCAPAFRLTFFREPAPQPRACLIQERPLWQKNSTITKKT